MPILWPDIAWKLIWELNKTIFVGEVVRLTDLPAGSWSGSEHLNRCHCREGVGVASIAAPSQGPEGTSGSSSGLGIVV